MKTVEVTCKIKVVFNSYNKKSLDKKAMNNIKKWIKESIIDECNYIPLYIKKNENGSFTENRSMKIKIYVF